MSKFIRLFMLTVLTVLPLSVILAQDEAEADTALNGTWVQSATSGNFTEAEETDTYILTLATSSDAVQWIETSDSLRAGSYPAIEFQGDWDFAAQEMDLTVEGILTTQTETITLLLSAPVYDDGMFSYTVTVASIQPFDPEADAEKAELPMSFDEATLFIPFTEEFLQALLDGSTARLESTRDTSKPTCNVPNRCG